jgi:alkylation response protein AidB-like acyl-CoA dehydrogenase
VTDDLAKLAAAIAAAQSGVADYHDPTTASQLLALLARLYAIGRRDLPLGRLVEGHFDALQIIGRYAPTPVVADAHTAARNGATFGVWNADLPGEPLRFEHGRLSGAKSYTSGAGVLSHALVTTDTPAGRQLLLLDLAATAPAIDRDWWDVVGMARSHTHRVRWNDVAIEPAAVIGAANDYAREPFFSGGALRFVAVHAGGVAALFDHVRDHLVATGRADDPMQVARVARLFDCAELAAATVRRTAERWFDEPDEQRLPRVAATRLQVAGLADQAIVLAQETVGLQGLLRGHPLAAAITDLMVYLRQPAPDAQRDTAGRAALAGLLVPTL